MAEINKDDLRKQLKEERKGNIHISFSEFSLYNQCPQQHLIYKYLGLDERPPSIHLYFGNAVHESIEMAVKEGYDIDGRVKYFRDKFKTDMMDNMMGTKDFDETENFLNQGENILRILDVKEVLGGDDVFSVEEELYEPIFKIFRFKGFIDVTSQNPLTKRYRITDWKTSGEKWSLSKKLKDKIFMCQMRLYKYFWAKKNNIPLDQIDCRYVVLNRLKNKKDPNGGFGEVQIVDIESSEDEILEALNILAETIRKIHIAKEFPKVKFTGNERWGCMFCKFKGGIHPLCNSKYNQYLEILAEHGK